jgi:hypothetical protein
MTKIINFPPFVLSTVEGLREGFFSSLLAKLVILLVLPMFQALTIHKVCNKRNVIYARLAFTAGG